MLKQAQALKLQPTPAPFLDPAHNC